MAQTTMINSKKMSELVSHVCIRATDSIGVKEKLRVFKCILFVDLRDSG
jgi:hypothetical protein